MRNAADDALTRLALADAQLPLLPPPPGPGHPCSANRLPPSAVAQISAVLFDMDGLLLVSRRQPAYPALRSQLLQQPLLSPAVQAARAAVACLCPLPTTPCCGCGTRLWSPGHRGNVHGGAAAPGLSLRQGVHVGAQGQDDGQEGERVAMCRGPACEAAATAASRACSASKLRVRSRCQAVHSRTNDTHAVLQPWGHVVFQADPCVSPALSAACAACRRSRRHASWLQSWSWKAKSRPSSSYLSGR